MTARLSTFLASGGYSGTPAVATDGGATSGAVRGGASDFSYTTVQEGTIWTSIPEELEVRTSRIHHEAHEYGDTNTVLVLSSMLAQGAARMQAPERSAEVGGCKWGFEESGLSQNAVRPIWLGTSATQVDTDDDEGFVVMTRGSTVDAICRTSCSSRGAKFV